MPEARARENIDHLLTEAGWTVQSRDEANIYAGRGVAIRYFRMLRGEPDLNPDLDETSLAALASLLQRPASRPRNDDPCERLNASPFYE